MTTQIGAAREEFFAGKVALIGVAESLVAVSLSAAFVGVAVTDRDQWPAAAVLAIGVGFFLYGAVKAYRFTPLVTVASTAISLGLLGAFSLSDYVWRQFPALFMLIAASTAIALAALKAIVTKMLERQHRAQ